MLSLSKSNKHNIESLFNISLLYFAVRLVLRARDPFDRTPENRRNSWLTSTDSSREQNQIYSGADGLLVDITDLVYTRRLTPFYGVYTLLSSSANLLITLTGLT